MCEVRVEMLSSVHDPEIVTAPYYERPRKGREEYFFQLCLSLEDGIVQRIMSETAKCGCKTTLETS